MIIIPAIDIINGKGVRLYQGDYTKETQVAEDVLKTAKSFEEAGAKYIHLVDLDGAKKGEIINGDTIIKVVNNLDIPVEVGGGIRNYESIKYLIDSGVSRVILGTSAIEDENLLNKAIKEFGEKIAVGIDCKNGYLCGRGWLEKSSLYYIDFAKRLEKIGVKNIIVTDISKDGTLKGPNIEMLSKLKQEVSMDITASGGIRDMRNIEQLNDMNIYGCITGKAIYSKTLSLKEAVDFTEGRN